MSPLDVTLNNTGILIWRGYFWATLGSLTTVLWFWPDSLFSPCFCFWPLFSPSLYECVKFAFKAVKTLMNKRLLVSSIVILSHEKYIAYTGRGDICEYRISSISYWPSARAVLGEYRPEVLTVRTELLQRGPYKKDRGPIFSQYGPEQTRSIRDLLHDFVFYGDIYSKPAKFLPRVKRNRGHISEFKSVYISCQI